MAHDVRSSQRANQQQHKYYRTRFRRPSSCFFPTRAPTTPGATVFRCKTWQLLFSSGTHESAPRERFFTTLHNENSAKLRKHFFLRPH